MTMKMNDYLKIKEMIDISNIKQQDTKCNCDCDCDCDCNGDCSGDCSCNTSHVDIREGE